MKSTIEMDSAIEVMVIFGEKTVIKARIFERRSGRVVIKPIRPGARKWEAAKEHLLLVARGCFKGSTKNGELTTILTPGGLMAYLHRSGTIAL